jgi:hypothetical protein
MACVRSRDLAVGHPLATMPCGICALCGSGSEDRGKAADARHQAQVAPVATLLNRDQSDSRRASAAACKRALTSPSSRAARSMRSCWVSARSCALSARERRASNSAVSFSTALVRSANWLATISLSSRATLSRLSAFYGVGSKSPVRGEGSSRENKPASHPRKFSRETRAFGRGVVPTREGWSTSHPANVPRRILLRKGK